MSDPPINLDDVAALPVIDPGDSLTRFDPYVMVPPDVRDALVEAVEALRDIAENGRFYVAEGVDGPVIVKRRNPEPWMQERARAALARFAPPRAQEGDADG